jgi:hypothetical protein
MNFVVECLECEKSFASADQPEVAISVFQGQFTGCPQCAQPLQLSLYLRDSSGQGERVGRIELEPGLQLA